MRIKTSCIFLLLSWLTVYSQTSRQVIDSLLRKLNKDKYTDTALVNIYNDIAYNYVRIKPDSTAYYSDKGLMLAKGIGFKKGIAMAYNNLGVYNHLLAKYDDAVKYYNQSLKIREEIGDKKATASSLNNIGIVLYLTGKYGSALKNFDKALQLQQEANDTLKVANTFNYIASVKFYLADYQSALSYYLKALKLYERSNDKAGIAQAHNNIGIIYSTLENSEEALNHYFISLKISEDANDKYNVASGYNNIGTIYLRQKKLDKALDCFKKSFAAAEEINNVQGIAYGYTNLGNVYVEQKDFSNALYNFNQALKISRESSNKQSESNVLTLIANVHIETGKYIDALNALDSAMFIVKKVNLPEGILNCYAGYSNLYKRQQQFKKSFEYFKLYSNLKDSLFNQEKSQTLAELQTRFETEKRENEIALLQQSNKIQELKMSSQEEKLNRQKTLIGGSVFVSLLVFVFLIMLVKNYNDKKKHHLNLMQKNNQINQQKFDIETASEKIKMSIERAKDIQQSVIPDEQKMKELLPDSFLLFLPKDVVSGDFYWIKKNQNKVWLAVVDCTGHGVPGAFMSMLAFNLLESISEVKDVLTPSVFLEKLNNSMYEYITDAANQSSKIGMDISIVLIDEKTKSIQYSGAHNPLWYIDSFNELIQLKADKISLGKMPEQSFINHEINDKNATYYLFTDGYADQIGEASKKKLLSQRFKEIIKANAHKEKTEQCRELIKFHNEWRGNREQIDDITVIGFKV